MRVAEPLETQPEPRSAGLNGLIAVGLVGAIAVATWLPHLPNALWLDEVVSAWVVQDGLSELFERAVTFQSQAAYFLLLWLWTTVAGTSEIALRLPSVIAALGACAAMARLGFLLTRDRECGLLAMLVLATSWNVFRESVDVRPYMPALLCLLCLAICLHRWLEEGRWRQALLVGALAGLLPHLHLFFTLAYPAFALWVLMSRPSVLDRVPQIAAIGGLMAVGGLLFVPAFQTLVANGTTYSFAPLPRWSALFSTFVWPAPVAGLLIGICVAGLIGSGAGSGPADESAPGPRVSRAVTGLLTLWMLGPLLVLFFVSLATDVSIFLGRYLIAATPAVALLYALALRRIPSGSARIAAALVVAVASFTIHERAPEDFRAAALAVNEFVGGSRTVPVLLASGLVEAQDERWIRDPERAAYLNAATAYYPIAGRVVAFPRRAQGSAVARELADPVLAEAQRFVAIEWSGNGARILSWLIPRAEQAGFRVTPRGFGGVRVAFFRRQGPPRR